MNHFLEKSVINAVIGRLQEQSKALFDTKNTPKIICNFIEDRPYSKLAMISVFANEYKKNLYIKIGQTRESIQREFHALSFFYNEFQGQTKYGIIKPLIYYDSPPALVTEEGSGTTFANIIREKAKLLPSKENLNLLIALCKNCGECLRYFQSIWPVPENIITSKTYRFEETVDFIYNQLSQCFEKRLLDKKIEKLILRYVAIEAESVLRQRIKITGMHSDFILSNMLIDDDRVQLLDFGGFKLGPSCRDVANFLYSLDILQTNPLFRYSTINKLKKGFMEGYGWSEDVENLPLFHLFQIREILGGLLAFSEGTRNNLISRLKTFRWRMLTERLLLSMMKDKPFI